MTQRILEARGIQMDAATEQRAHTIGWCIELVQVIAIFFVPMDARLGLRRWMGEGWGGEGRMRGNRAIGQGTHRSRGRTQEKANENARLKPFPFPPFHFW